ncbi:hypothetical protein PMKS-002294 [Pichia membranifaciens]|uniref:PX domain-containing protein n=1 Tax=Pichia membranifaciens TaxID=4926 RepID=A0A1Q2YH16_9ASCO|nr:hypothetical protein PMKS-002294 [Pichia membranifaciens]
MESSNTIKVFIPTITQVGSYSLYDLEIEIHLNKFKVERFRISKRYSDFVTLRGHLESQHTTRLPELPSKYASLYKRNETLLNERKLGLMNFATSLLNDRQLRAQSQVLNFFNIPRSTIVELNMLNVDKSRGEEKSKGASISRIDSAQHWMEVYKTIKSLLQDSRTRMFNRGNVVEIRRNLKTSETNADLLKSYLSTTQELGSGEIRRRKELLLSVTKEIAELNDMLRNMKLADLSEKTSNSSVNTNDLFKTHNPSGRRTLGRIKESAQTKKLDNQGLLQVQQNEMQDQDQSLSALRDMIIRQKQIGIAVNEEIGIQNELLDSLNQEVDQSTNKLKVAKGKINKIL